jgi:hypothetical protein
VKIISETLPDLPYLFTKVTILSWLWTNSVNWRKPAKNVINTFVLTLFSIHYVANVFNNANNLMTCFTKFRLQDLKWCTDCIYLPAVRLARYWVCSVGCLVNAKQDVMLFFTDSCRHFIYCFSNNLDENSITQK